MSSAGGMAYGGPQAAVGLLPKAAWRPPAEGEAGARGESNSGGASPRPSCRLAAELDKEKLEPTKKLFESGGDITDQNKN